MALFDTLWAGWRSTYINGTGTRDAGTRGARAGDSAGDGAARGARAGDGACDGACEGSSVDSSAACVFCALLDAPMREGLVVWRDSLTMILLNLYPYTTGHLLVLPRRHVEHLEDLDEDESAQLWAGMRRGAAALQAAYRPEGLNMGFNLGGAAGAGIPGHLHGHILPRWYGDTNFMTSVASTRVLPESLDVTWERIVAQMESPQDL